jgi:transcriptional regulator with XRE-family HTH domain
MLLRIKELREERGIGQQEMADRLGIHITNYNKLENGKSKPSIERFQTVAQILGCDLKDLFGDPPKAWRSVRVATTVEAGNWSEGLELEHDRRVVAIPDRPEWRKLTLRAAIVRGDSMNRRYPDGSIIVFTDMIETNEPLRTDAAYVVERERHGEFERTCKVLIRRRDRTLWLLPDSNDPTFEAFPVAGRDTSDELRILGRVVWSSRTEPD